IEMQFLQLARGAGGGQVRQQTAGAVIFERPCGCGRALPTPKKDVVQSPLSSRRRRDIWPQRVPVVPKGGAPTVIRPRAREECSAKESQAKAGFNVPPVATICRWIG